MVSILRAGAVAVLGWLVAGCTGEQVQPAQADDAGVDGSSVSDGSTADALPSDGSGTDSGGCATVPGNLVQNPSFELASMGAPTGWTMASGVAAVRREGDAAHCAAWAEVTFPAASTSFPTWFGQEIVVDPAPAKGSKLTATFWLRALDGTIGDIDIRIGVVSGSYDAKAIVLNADQTWKQYSTQWTLPDEPFTSLAVSVESMATTARRIGIDHVTFVVTPP